MAKITTYEELIAFFADIARRNKKLNPENAAASSHFYQFTEQILTSNINFPCLIVMPDEYTVGDTGDNTHQYTNVEFWVSDKCPPQSSQTDEAAILLNLHNIVWELLSEIDRKYRQQGIATNRPMTFLDRNKFRFLQHGPFGPHNAIGYRVEFEFGVARALAINSNNWYSS